MSTGRRSGNNRRSGLGKYEEYNGFGEFNRDSYVGFDDEDVKRRYGDYIEFSDDDLQRGRDGGAYSDDADFDTYDNYDRYGDTYEDEYEEYEDGYEDEYEGDDGYDEDDDYYYDEPVRRRNAGGSSRNRRSSRDRSGRSSRGGSGRRTSKSNAGGRPSGEARSKRSSGKAGKNGKPKKKSKAGLFVIEILIFLMLLGALFFVLKWDTVEKVDLKESEIYINEELKQALDGGTQTETGEATPDWGMEGYKNIALFGVDAGGTRSDTIIIASINEKTHDVKMCSVYRDTYLNVDSMENPVYNKANSAYAKGGPEQAIRMLNMNLDMNVDDFMTVDFAALEDVIDDLGGVEINVQQEEIYYINDYQFSIVMGLGGPKEGKITNPRNFISVTEPGPQTLNGLQATAYCRIRYTAGSDFRRTERQREVISQIVNKAKHASPAQLNKVLDDVLPRIKTSFTAAELGKYAMDIKSYNIVESKGFPFENVTGKINRQSMVVPTTLASNVNEMHTFLFGTTEYSPSSAVQEISDHIESDKTKSGL